jgi:hypothetical protein
MGDLYTNSDFRWKTVVKFSVTHKKTLLLQLMSNIEMLQAVELAANSLHSEMCCHLPITIISNKHDTKTTG